MLKTLREFRGDFSTVTMAPDGTISVTYAPPVAEAPKAEKRTQPAKTKLSAIESLSRQPPVFDFEVPS